VQPQIGEMDVAAARRDGGGGGSGEQRQDQGFPPGFGVCIVGQRHKTKRREI
jgi:hypothetical protein